MTFDILGIGLGPFNLGLAALSADIPQLSTAFIEQQPDFNWHPGLLLPGARLQVPFYADLVTLVRPQSRFSWFSFLQAKQRLFRFGVQDNPFPLRREYNEYGQWVTGQLKNICFGHQCTAVQYNEIKKAYGVTVLEIKTGIVKMFHAKHLVIGVGTQPVVPACVQPFLRQAEPPIIFHASKYGFNQERLTAAPRITLIGSGQSAAEVFQDLLNRGRATEQLSWFTRSPRFFPMEATPAAFELASPDYRTHFYSLPPALKEFVLAGQDALYKGINSSLLTSIYDQLYQRLLDNPDDETALYPNCELLDVQVRPHGRDNTLVTTPSFSNESTRTQKITCTVRHQETTQVVEHHTDALILATGYQQRTPEFLEPINDRIRYLASGAFDLAADYSITADQSIFLQNADMHSHGFASADLSFGPYRNAVILNTILGYKHFRLEQNTTFQQFNGQENNNK